MNGYKNLEIWRLGMQLVEITYSLKGFFPIEERYRLWGQLSSSVEAFPQNIAEGYGKPSPPDFAHYIDNALATLLEAETSFIIAVKKGYLSDAIFNEKIQPLVKEIFNKTRKFKGWVFKRGGKFHRTTRPPDHQTTGFTLIELLVVISVITLLTAFAVPAFVSFQKSQTLNAAAGKLKEDLRLLQSKATSSIAVDDQSRAWGAHLVAGSNSYQFFYCTPDSTRYSEYRLETSRCPVSTSTTVSFNTPTVVTNFSGESPTDIVFDVLTGTVIVNGGVLATDLQLSVAYADGSDSRLIRVGPGGSIGD